MTVVAGVCSDFLVIPSGVHHLGEGLGRTVNGIELLSMLNRLLLSLLDHGVFTDQLISDLVEALLDTILLPGFLSFHKTLH